MWNVIIFEVLRALKKKSFWVASFMPPLIVLAVFGVEYFSVNASKSSSAQLAQTSSVSTKIAALDDSGLVSQKLLAAGHIAIEPTKGAGIAAVASGGLGAFLYYPADVSTSGIQIYAQDQGIGQTPYNDLATNLLKQSVAAEVSAAIPTSTQAVTILENAPAVTVTTYKNGVQTPGFAGAIAPGFFAVAFFLLIILLSPVMISSTAEEKENRASEILLTSIKAGDLIGGKMISILILGAVQSVAIIAPIVIALLRFPALLQGISLSSIPLDPGAIAIGALFLAAGFALYTGLIMGVGSMIPGTSTANRFMGIFIIWVFVPLYTISLVITDPRNVAVTILTYFPLTAPTMVLLRNALGSLSLGDAAIAFAIVAATAAFTVWFAVRAFRYGSMEHGRRISLKELLH
jgi:ABC-2 type transport system permease protein